MFNRIQFALHFGVDNIFVNFSLPNFEIFERTLKNKLNYFLLKY